MVLELKNKITELKLIILWLNKSCNSTFMFLYLYQKSKIQKLFATHKITFFFNSGHSSGYDSRSARAFPYGNGKYYF